MSKITENWCTFVLNEGIMPSIITRKLRNLALSDTDLCILIADILNNRGIMNLKDSDILPNSEDIKASFKADPELSNWLESIRELLDIIKNYANKDKIFVNIADEACLSFINACSLVSDVRKELYSDKSPNNESYILLSTNSDIKQAFREYLKNKHYSHNAINSYVSGINKVGKLANIQRNLWEINDANEMMHLIAHWENNTNHLYDEYKELDLRSRRTLSNAVKRYAEFLTYQSQGK